jgi:hypothetical protein
MNTTGSVLHQETTGRKQSLYGLALSTPLACAYPSGWHDTRSCIGSAIGRDQLRVEGRRAHVAPRNETTTTVEEAVAPGHLTNAHHIAASVIRHAMALCYISPVPKAKLARSLSGATNTALLQGFFFFIVIGDVNGYQMHGCTRDTQV